MRADSAAGIELLAQIARRFRRARAFRVAGLSIAGSALAVGLVSRWAPGWAIAAIVVATATTLALLAAASRRRHGDLANAARHLDRVEPAAEESAMLWLEEPASALEALQRRRTSNRLAPADARTWFPDPPWKRSVAIVIGGLLLGALAARWPSSPRASASAASEEPARERSLDLLAIETTVTPPSYLGLAPRSAASLGTTAEHSARVEWRAEVEGEPTDVVLEAAGRDWPLARDGDVWRLSRIVEATEIVTLRLRRADRTWSSPAARLSIVPDEPPEVRFVEPTAVVERRLSDLGNLPLRIEATDDHAVAKLDLVVTLASGVGEGVSFEEQRRPLAVGEGPSVRASSALDLRSFGLGPGSELYLVAEARDLSPEDRRGRSEPVVVRVLAEGGESSGLGRGLVLRNELEALRSQRQVLMDTERLVAQAARPPGLSSQEFERRSHVIGLDQRAVRLRYGELLGQEVEDGATAEPGGGHDDEPAANGRGSNASPNSPLDLVPEGMVHSHDSAEMATFFADPVRRQLRTMLAQMWEAELRLRTLRPREALPFEREALRLLKILQEASRVYVPKFSSPLPPFDERRRLTGDRSKASDVRLRLLRQKAATTEAERWWRELSRPQARLDGLASFLEREAARGELDDLSILDAARRIEAADSAATPRAVEDVRSVAGGVWSLLPVPEPAPWPRGDAGALIERMRPRGGER